METFLDFENPFESSETNENLPDGRFRGEMASFGGSSEVFAGILKPNTHPHPPSSLPSL